MPTRCWIVYKLLLFILSAMHSFIFVTLPYNLATVFHLPFTNFNTWQVSHEQGSQWFHWAGPHLQGRAVSGATSHTQGMWKRVLHCKFAVWWQILLPGNSNSKKNSWEKSSAKHMSVACAGKKRSIGCSEQHPGYWPGSMMPDLHPCCARTPGNTDEASTGAGPSISYPYPGQFTVCQNVHAGACNGTQSSRTNLSHCYLCLYKHMPLHVGTHQLGPRFHPLCLKAHLFWSFPCSLFFFILFFFHVLCMLFCFLTFISVFSSLFYFTSWWLPN